jgi:hypothetical protein
MEKRHVANIVLPDNRTFKIVTNAYSYDVSGFIVRTTSGQPRAVFGCRDALDAFRVAKSLARKWKSPLPDTKLWKLQYID